MEFSASYDRTAKIVSTLVCLVLLSLTLVIHNITVTCLSILIIVVAYAYSPRGYVLEDGAIFVKRLISSARVLLEDVRDARRATPGDFRSCLRLWGSGGLFGYYGLFTTAKLGKSTWYVTNREKGVVVIAGPKTVLFSLDDPDEFLAAIRDAAPMIAPEPAAGSNAPRRYATLGRLGTIIVGFLVIAAIGTGIFANTYSPGAPRYTLTPQTLSIHDRFYPVTLQASSVDIPNIRVVDLKQDAEWRPTRRTNGFANEHYRAGWFLVASGQKVRLYQADGARVVLLPPKGDSPAVLFQASDPASFVSRIRSEWSAVARNRPNAGN
ncbi:MAG: hypothetical protein JOZ32_15970 [Bryobacterales bacterium]|nr:hypothetical protein [Bryobacterales bacterium]